MVGIQSTPNGVTLPTNVQKLSECIPNMGEHWGNPANLPFGPIYNVYKGKVVGVEFMIHEDELEKNILSIAGEKVGKPVIMPTLGLKFEHIELNYEPEGHVGDTESHYDVHMYLISSQEQEQLCK